MARANYVQLDIEKPAENGQSLVNLMESFQGRVGDKLASVDLQLMRNGRPLDLTNKSVGFEGVDPKGERYNAVGYMAFDKPGSNMQLGKVNYYFPAGTFTTEGLWDTTSTFFYVTDGTTRVSTINVYLNVLANMVEMGIEAAPFKTDMDKVVAELQSYVNTKRTEIDNIAPELKQMENTMTALKTQLDTYTQLIQDKAVPTTSQMQTYVKQLLSATATTADLNTLLDPTNYAVIAGATNNPSSEAGLLKVSGDDDLLVQVLIDNKQSVWIRSRIKGVWTDWLEQTGWTE